MLLLLYRWKNKCSYLLLCEKRHFQSSSLRKGRATAITRAEHLASTKKILFSMSALKILISCYGYFEKTDRSFGLTADTVKINFVHAGDIHIAGCTGFCSSPWKGVVGPSPARILGWILLSVSLLCRDSCMDLSWQTWFLLWSVSSYKQGWLYKKGAKYVGVCSLCQCWGV